MEKGALLQRITFYTGQLARLSTQAVVELIVDILPVFEDDTDVQIHADTYASSAPESGV